MKTRHFILAALALLCSTTLLTACGGDDDNGNPPAADNTRAYVAMSHYTQLTADMLKYCKVVLTTVNGEGTVNTHVVTDADIKNGYFITTFAGKLPCELKVTRTVTLLDENVDASTITSLEYYRTSNYIAYYFFNANKQPITNDGVETGSTQLSTVKGTTEKAIKGFFDLVKAGSYNTTLTFVFDKDGKVIN